MEDDESVRTPSPEDESEMMKPLKISRIETRGELSPRQRASPAEENVLSFVVRMASQEEEGENAEHDNP